ncbi:pilus assembly PilX family protein [Agaribacterium haliotis]|uniref:pilus assembly PilX family protein n=1 Tax=Agaribacterium haliotis TaxID=2013869 RepID=UPI000BB5547E|nr:PilX N-terminal domain-containing pilus assembly protein [Agaribacterium haliotis]
MKTSTSLQLPVLSQQQGATLVVALIILLVMTLLGLSSVRSSNTQLKMATYSQNRQQAFKLAESALEWIEDDFSQNGHLANKVRDCSSGSADCFDSSCTGGLCFNGYYSTTAGHQAPDCSVIPNPVPTDPPLPFWVRSDLAVWETSSRHQTVAISGYPGFEQPKYIAEFLCYTDMDANDSLVCESASPNNCVALYRYTVLAESKDGKSRVMVQSVARVNAI